VADHTGISWTDATWNPVRGCSRVSEGCRNCYAEGIAARFSDGGLPYHGFAQRGRLGSKWTGKVDVMWPVIDLPIRWRRPRRIFVNSMSDLFHEELPDEEIATIFAMMVAAHHLRGHTLQVLTKRSNRMRRTLNSEVFWDQVNAEAGALVLEHCDPLNRRSDDARATCRDDYGPGNPPPGIWLGVSVENQAAADERIPDLMAVPASVRFLSCEPLLGPLDIKQWLQPVPPASAGVTTAVHQPVNGVNEWHAYGPTGFITGWRGIDWTIVGGESGPGARPMHPAWARSLRDQCAAASVPFHFKQWGEWTGSDQVGANDCRTRERRYIDDSGQECHGSLSTAVMHRIGTKAAGDLLDGRQHHEFPA
jgi:protein gp37